MINKLKKQYEKHFDIEDIKNRDIAKLKRELKYYKFSRKRDIAKRKYEEIIVTMIFSMICSIYFPFLITTFMIYIFLNIYNFLNIYKFPKDKYLKLPSKRIRRVKMRRQVLMTIWLLSFIIFSYVNLIIGVFGVIIIFILQIYYVKNLWPKYDKKKYKEYDEKFPYQVQRLGEKEITNKYYLEVENYLNSIE